MNYYLGGIESIACIIYEKLDSWQDRAQFSALNRGSRIVAFSMKTNLDFTLSSDNDLSKLNHLALKTTKVIRLKNLLSREEESIKAIASSCHSCKTIVIDIDHEITLKHMKKLAIECSKRGLDIQVEQSPQMEVLQRIINHFMSRNRKDSEATVQPVPLKRKATIAIEVPSDNLKRMCFYLDEAKKLALNAADVVASSNDFYVPEAMQRYIVDYRNCTFDPLKMPTPPQPNTANLDASIRSFAASVLGSVVSFQSVSFYVTSCDIFVHNHLDFDDCAYEMSAQQYHLTPTAKIKMKSFMGKTEYYELSILYGFFEALVIGCVHQENNSHTISANLGSSLSNWRFGTMETKHIHVSISPESSNNQSISTPRLLKNYLRRAALKEWGFHLSFYYLSGLSPLVPVNVANHHSQLNKKLTIFHFASKLLCLTTSRFHVSRDMLEDLFMFFVSCAIVPTNGSRDFQKASAHQQKQQTKQVYLCLLLEIAAFVESKVQQNNGCYVFEELQLEKKEGWPLRIMNDGLKKFIFKENVKIEGNMHF